MQDFDCATSYYDTPEAPADTVQASQMPSPDACENPRNAWLYRTASYVSAVFSPLLTPTYCMMVALWATPLNVLPEGTRLSSAAVVLGLTCFCAFGCPYCAGAPRQDSRHACTFPPSALYAVPSGCGMLLHCRHGYGKCPCSRVAERIFPWGIIGYACGIRHQFFWKISAHATAVGGLFAVLFYIAAAGLNEYYFMPWLTAGALIAGLTGTARLILGAHTLCRWRQAMHWDSVLSCC